MSPKKSSPKSAKTPAKGKFSAEERAAMKEYVKELKGGGEGEASLLAKVNSMKEPDRGMAKRIHAIVTANAPQLTPKTWYGMPAWADADGKAVLFFQDAAKFKARYATLGFNDRAKLDDGVMWPTSFALKNMTAAEEARITALVKK